MPVVNNDGGEQVVLYVEVVEKVLINNATFRKR